MGKCARRECLPGVLLALGRLDSEERSFGNSLKGKISQVEVVEGFDSRPHKAVSFAIEREKEMQKWNEQKLPKVLPGYRGGRLPGRSPKESGGEEEEEGENSKEKK